jgi:hypothetical protein
MSHSLPPSRAFHERAPRLATCVALFLCLAVPGSGLRAARTSTGSPEQLNLAQRLTSGGLRVVNREATPLPERPGAIRLSERAGDGVAWIEGTNFGEGTIDLQVRGRDVFQQSFLGIVFNRTSDTSYEGVYLRPFNFRATDPDRHQHAVQYIAVPDYNWPRLRKEFPEEFENPVDASVDPLGWVRLRVVVSARSIQIFVGVVKTPTLEVRRLQTATGGSIGLWVGNNSNGDFADLVLTPAK